MLYINEIVISAMETNELFYKKISFFFLFSFLIIIISIINNMIQYNN